MALVASRPRLLLLPGLLCDGVVWQAQIAALADHVDIRVADFYGARSLPEMAERALDLCDGPFAVAGHSMGGRVAFEIWRRAPERVQGLALLDTGAHPPRATERESRLALVRLAREEGMIAVAEHWLPPMLCPGLAQSDDPRARAIQTSLTAMVCRANPDIFAGQQAALLARRDAFALMASITVPTLVLCGRQDGWSPPDQHAEIASRIDGAVLSLIENCGHMSTVERPDEVTAALVGWLARVPDFAVALAPLTGAGR